MSLTNLITPSIKTVKDQCAQHKLILFPPASRYRALLVAGLLSDPPYPLFYAGVSGGDVSLDDYLNGLVDEIGEQQDGFGKNCRKALEKDPKDIDALASAFARDINDLSKDDFLLLVDGFDRPGYNSKITTFMTRLIAQLPAQCHLMISSRTLPQLPWLSMVASGEAVILKDGEPISGTFYTEHVDEHPNVEVFALGPGYVLIDGAKVDTWDGDLPRLLLFFGLDRPTVTRNDICQAFWPELDEDQAVNVFHVTKRRMHKALGFDTLIHESGHYRVNPALNLYYDVIAFVEQLSTARSLEGAEAVPHWRRAVDLYRGAYLQGRDEGWITARQEDYQAGYIEALLALARFYDSGGEQIEALGYYLRTLAEAPNREDLHRAVLRLYGELGRYHDAEKHYKYLREKLLDQYGVEPAPETQAVYKEVAGA